MNDAAVIDPPEVFADKAVPLLKEYLEKVLDIRRELRELRERSRNAGSKQHSANTEIDGAEFDYLFWYFHQIEPALREFNQQISGMIDQGRISPLTKSELRLRLAEIEGVLSQMHHLFTAYEPHLRR
jgi:hypothetical protein